MMTRLSLSFMWMWKYSWFITRSGIPRTSAVKIRNETVGNCGAFRWVQSLSGNDHHQKREIWKNILRNVAWMNHLQWCWFSLPFGYEPRLWMMKCVFDDTVFRWTDDFCTVNLNLIWKSWITRHFIGFSVYVVASTYHMRSDPNITTSVNWGY